MSRRELRVPFWRGRMRRHVRGDVPRLARDRDRPHRRYRPGRGQRVLARLGALQRNGLDAECGQGDEHAQDRRSVDDARFRTIEPDLHRGGRRECVLDQQRADRPGYARSFRQRHGDPKTGGTATTLASDRDVIGYLAASRHDLLWLENDVIALDGGTSGNAYVARLPKTGDRPAVFAESVPPYEFYGAVLAIDATSVYWSQVFNLVKEPIGGGALTTLVPETFNDDAGISFTIGLAVNSRSAFFSILQCNGTCGPTDTLESVPKGGGTTTTLATGLDEPENVVADDTNVYWIDTNGYASGSSMLQGSILSLPTTGGTPTTLATDQEQASPLAVDTTSLYWGVEPCSFTATCPGKLMKRTPK